MLKIVIFDLDGTIGDTMPLCTAAFRKAVEPYLGRPMSNDEMANTFGLNEEGMIRRVTGPLWHLALSDFYKLYEQMHYLCQKPFDGIKEVLDDLRSLHLHVALVTGKGERNCTFTLDRFGLSDAFERLETGSPDYNRKSEAIGDTLKAFGCKHDEALYVGDTLSDVQSCREVGVECLSAAWADGTAVDELERVNPGNVVYSIAELHFVIKKRLFGIR